MNARLNLPAVRFKRVDFDPFAGGALELAYTAASTEPQQELWSASQLGADASCAFNECISLQFQGVLDVEGLKLALTSVVQRNEALRTTFAPGGEQFCVAEEAAFDFRIEDRSGDSLPAWRHEAVNLPFDLVHGPLFRAWLARTSASQYELILSAHHIVCDGWSMGVIVSQLAEIYSARVEMRGEVLDQPQEIVEYAGLQSDYLKSQEHKTDEKYWTSKFKDDIPALDLPLDRPRPPSRGYASAREDLWLPAKSVQAFRKMAAAHGCSLSAAAQAAFHVLLMRLTGQSSIVVGMPAAGQAMFGRESLVGHCVNLLPIRSELEPAMTFADLLKRFRETLHGAFDHQKYTYGELLKRLAIARDPSRMPLVCVMFNLDPGWTPVHHRFSGLRVEIRSNPRAFENFELFVNCVGKDGGLILEAQYKTELFERQTISGWMNAYLHLIEQFARDPALHIGRAELLNDVEFDKVIRQWNATDATLDSLLLAHEAIAAQALRTPERTAVIDVARSISYRELDARSNQLARYLLELGVRRGSLTGVAVDRGIDLMVALLGVLKTGSAYVPLDPDYPADRLEYMLRMSKTRVVVTDSVRKTQLPLGDAQPVCVDTDWQRVAKFSGAPLTSLEREAPRREDVAYVIFTSGSTGLPKGVQVLHLGMANFLRSMQREPGVAVDDVLLAVTTLSFDIAVLELYLPLMSGACVVIASRDDVMDAHRLADLIAQRSITVMQATPATWRMLLAAGWQGEKRLKALCGGEALTRDLSTSLLSLTGELWNMYGPTETTVWSTCKRIESAQEQISIGRPLDNTQVYILNDAGVPQPPGAAGELFIAGDGVALGYLGRDELTAERFSADPFKAGNRMYRTGDLGRWRSDGMLECLGRNDGQVKVRGFRIELGEIEAVLMGTGLLSECSVIVREDTPGDQRLVAYFASDRELRPDDLKGSIQKKLPAYMVPQNWLQMPSLPKTLNGKIDRKRLPVPGTAARSKEKSPEAALPTTPTERFVHEIWKEVLKREDFGVQDDFFLLGGHSLLATQLLARIQRAGRHAPTLRELFHLTTVEKLAQWIEQQAPVQQVAQIAHKPGRTAAPLSPMQLRVWYLEQINPGTATYNLPALFRFKGPFDAEALQAAWSDIVARHAALRTSVVVENGEAVQRIEPSLSAELPLVVCSESEMLGRAEKDAATPFNLTQAPLLRGTLFRLDPQTHALYFVAHHLVWDGWSFDVFLREIKELYEAHSQRRDASLPQLQISYGDFCQWQREEIEGSATLAREKAFWLNQLSGTLPVLDLPTDRPRPPQMSFAGASREFHWDKALVGRMTEFARAHGVTLQMFLLAGFKVLLSRLANLSDVIVGAPIQGRTMRETEDLIGFFVNTLVLRTAVDGDAAFSTVLERVRGTCLDAYSHQQMPFEILVESLKPRRDLSRTPIFQCFFTYQDVARREWSLGATSVDQINVHTGVVPTDLSLWVKVGNDGLVGAIDYSTALFDASTIGAWVDAYLGILSAAMRQPATRVSAFIPHLGDGVRANSAASIYVSGSSDNAGGHSAASGSEKYLLALWQELLGVQEIRPTDNFFDLGGHSLLSMQMIARIEREKGKRLSPRLILMSSLTQIAAELAGEEKDAVAPVTGQRETVPFFFAGGLFGTHHRPRMDSQIGVLICAPIAQEYMRTHWLFRQLANQLVREGIHVMRFDYTGCGDSRGASLSGGPVQWTLDVQAAAEEFRRRSGIRHMAVIGARMGAYLAAAAVPEADLILWDPIESGADYLNELEAVHRAKFPGSESSQEVGLGGFEFTPALRTDIGALKLDAVIGRARKVRLIRSAELGENAGWQSAADWNHAVLSGTILQALRQARAGMTS